MNQRGFILQSGLTLYAAIGALVAIALLSAAVWVQSARLASTKAEYALFVAKVEALGEAALADKVKKEQEHEKVLTDVSQAWKGSLDAAVTGAVARYRLRDNSPGGGTMRGVTLDPQAPDGASGQCLPCAPDAPFIEACAADAAKIDSFQIWSRSIGFPVK